MENKKQLIYREDLIAEYDRVHIGPPGGARKLMENAVAVDAVEVVHGRWEPTNPINNFTCSQCKHRYISVFVKTWNYCPNCGAKMDQED